MNSRSRSVWNVAYQTALHCARVSDNKTVLSTNDNTTKFCTSYFVVRAVLRLPLAAFLVFCGTQLGRRLDVGIAPRSDLLFELLLVRGQDMIDSDQVEVV